MGTRFSNCLLSPWQALALSSDRAADQLGYAGIAVMLFGLGIGWWLYVPLHELAHAFACIWSGGTVSRLEIAPVYGAALLAKWQPFVVVGSDYAGQLTGFDTAGNDLIYLATVLGPYALTLFPGIPLLVWSNQVLAINWRHVFIAGASLPWALAPFIALPGDMYEAGSIIVTRLVAYTSPASDMQRWRSDDVWLLASQLHEQGLTTQDWAIVGIAQCLGLLLAYLFYWAGRQFACALLRSQPKTAVRKLQQ